MNTVENVTFTTKEAQIIVEIIDSLSGGNPENVFAHDGNDSLDDAETLAFVKLFHATDKDHLIPDDLLAEFVRRFGEENG